MITLKESVESIPQISSRYSSLLKNIGITTVQDLLTYFPRKYINNSNLTRASELIENLNESETFILKGFVRNFKTIKLRGGRSLQTALFEDQTSTLKCNWFNQPFLKNVFNTEGEFYLSGKAKLKGKKIEFYPTIYEPVIEGKESVHLNRITPEYSLTDGISKKWFRNRIKWLVDQIEEIDFKDELQNKYVKEDLKTNLKDIHFPKNEESFFESIKEVSLYELSNIHLKLIKKRAKKSKLLSPEIKNLTQSIKLLNEFIDNLDFELTKDQREAINKIFREILKGNVIDLLLQGDVGSGKTIVSICASILVALSGYQVIILSPTTILANQHYNTFTRFLSHFDGIKIALVTSKTSEKEKADILIGTTAILARKSKIITNPGLLVVDEQHKFGVKQREELFKEYSFLENSKFIPHLINMSATPIPRSVIQVFFGDIDVIKIKEKPKNRLPIKTFVVPNEKRIDSLEWIKNEIKKGGQAYWVCSLIDNNEESEVKSVQSTFKELKHFFKKDLRIGILHGKMKDEEKTEITTNFANKKIDLLVSTTVIEVGIDVPNANIVVIEDADRFGLSQLHQIRGRVGRGEKESWCFFFASKSISQNGIQRLKFLTESNDGFEIAEFDLKNRGPGEIYGVQQAGIPNLKIADLSDTESILKSREIAEELFKKGIKKIELFN